MRNLNLNSHFLSTVLIILFALFLGAGAGQQLHAQNLIYVQQGGTGNGSSWGDAYGLLQDAYAAAQPGDVIVVGAGSYYPSTSDPTLLFSFNKDNVKMYGGYAGGENLSIDDLKLDERDFEANPSILNGNIHEVGAPQHPNSFRVVIMGSNLTSEAHFDGFTITGGVSNTLIAESLDGPGLQIQGGSPIIRNFLIEGNIALRHGGGLAITGASSPTIIDTIIRNNTALNGWGGAIYIGNWTNPTFINSIVYNNEASEVGALYSSGGLGEYINTTIVNNSITSEESEAGTAIHLTGHSRTITFSNSIVAHHPGTQVFVEENTILNQNSSSLGSTDTEADPHFADVANHDYRLRSSSPLKNAGDNSLIPGYITTDIIGDDRIQNGTVNMGAYETILINEPIIYVDAGAAGFENGWNWENAFTNLYDAMEVASDGDAIVVAGGTYLPGESHGEWIELIDNVSLYGGYEGTEELTPEDLKLDERDLEANVSIISGDLNQSGSTDGNGHILIGAAGVGSGTIVDGFVLRDAYDGSAIIINAASPQFRNVIIEENISEFHAPALRISNSSNARFINTIFRNNTSTSTGFYNNPGGAIHLDFFTNTEFINTLIYDNTTNGASGGGLYASFAQVYFINSVIAYNSSSSDGHQVYSSGSSVRFFNTAVKTPTNNDLTGGGFIDENSVVSGDMNDFSFADPDSRDFRLDRNSPMIDAGDNDLVPDDITTDLNGDDRIQNGTVSIGAYESPVPALIYVKHDATGANDGRSWGDAFHRLQDALDDALSLDDVIVVSGGTYTPTDGTDRNASFNLKDRVSVYGGFSGSEDISIADLKLDDRDLIANETILSGDIANDGERHNNVYHVVRAESVGSNSTFDGFTVRYGSGTNSSGDYSIAGSGIRAVSSNLNLSNLIIEENHTNTNGAGAKIQDGSPELINVIIRNNQADQNGGAIAFTHTDSRLINTLVHDNTALRGGAFSLNGTFSVELINATFAFNEATESENYQVFWTEYPGSQHIEFKNSIIWNHSGEISSPTNSNYTFTDSNVQGDEGVNPDFLNTGLRDFRLSEGSPLLNSGNNSHLPEGVDTDLLGHERIQNGTVNPGPYETPGVPDPFIYVNHDATGSENGKSWNSAFRNLSDALSQATGGQKILIAGGTYYPTEDPNNRNASFHLKNRVNIYGGYSGSETVTVDDMQLENRDFNDNKTTLSGNIDGSGDQGNFSNHIIRAQNLTGNTVLDGITVSHGFTSSSGAGLNMVNSNTTLRNTVFENLTANSGGAVYASNGAGRLLQIENSVFRQNTANSGGVFYGLGQKIKVINSLFHDNHANNRAALIYFANMPESDIDIINTTMARNSTNDEGGALFTVASTSQVRIEMKNSIVWDQEEPYVHFFQSVHEIMFTDSNIASDFNAFDPFFVDPDNGNYRLSVESPLIDMGPIEHIPEHITTDLDGNPRVFHFVDLGPYEFGTQTSISGDNTTDDFRFLGSPAGNVTLGELFEPFWSQGIPGSDDPNGMVTLYHWDAEEGQWAIPDNMDNPATPAKGYVKFIFDDQNYDGTPDGFPKIWGLQGTENEDLVPVTVFGVNSQILDEGNSTAGWNLLSNPWTRPVSVDNLLATLTDVHADVNRNVYIWDPNLEQTNSGGTEFGEYRILAEGDQEVIAPFQAFFVWFPEELQSNPSSVTLDRSNLIESGSAQPFSEGNDIPPLELNLDHETSGSKLVFRLDERVESLQNPYSASRLASFRGNYSLLYANGNYGPLSRVHIPENPEPGIEIQLDVSTNQQGTFTLSWDDLPDAWKDFEITVTDRVENRIVSLNEEREYRFEIGQDEEMKLSGGSERQAAVQRQTSRSGTRDYRAQERRIAETLTATRTEQEAREVPLPGLILPEFDGSQAEKTDGNSRFLLTITPITTSTDPAPELPREVALEQNYPNPFNPTTIIEYALPEHTDVRIDVFNAIGQRVQTLINGPQQAGYHTITFDASRLSSGVYFYRLQASGKVITHKMTLIK